MASGPDHKAAGGKKGRKKGRNYRWGDPPITHSTTKYRERHHIGNDEVRFPNSRKRARRTVDKGLQKG